MKLYKYIGHQDDNELLNIIENIFKDNTLKVTNPKDFNDVVKDFLMHQFID